MKIALRSDEQGAKENQDFAHINAGNYVIVVSADRYGGCKVFVEFGNAPFVTIHASKDGAIQTKAFSDAGAFVRDAFRQRELEEEANA